MASTSGTDTTSERPLVRGGRNLVLALGLLYAYGLILMGLQLAVGLLTANRTVSALSGEFPWKAFFVLRLPSALASVLASAITGFLAAIYLRFSRALLLVLVLAVLCAIANYRGTTWYVAPAQWERWLQTGTSIAIGVAMPLLFVLTYRSAAGAGLRHPSHEGGHDSDQPGR